MRNRMMKNAVFFFVIILITGFSASFSNDEPSNPLAGTTWYYGGVTYKVNTGNTVYDKLIADDRYDPEDKTETYIFKSDGTVTSGSETVPSI